MPKLITAQCELDLDCYPKTNSSSHQPWDAADLYLIEEAIFGSHPAILNDQWGALTGFIQLSRASFYSWTDSFCSKTAIKKNLNSQLIGKNNRQNTDCTTNHDVKFNSTKKSTDLSSSAIVSGQIFFPKDTDSLWIQCPKSFDQLHWWLSLAFAQLGPGIPVYVSGMAKHIPVKWLNWLENHNSDYQQYPIKKKARLMHFKLGDKLPHIAENKSYLGPDNIDISAQPGVFSRDHMDIGSRFFIHHLSQLPPLKGNVVDLGCGNGLLSIAVLMHSNHSLIDLILCDDSALALDAARKNLLLRDYDKATFIHTDALLNVEGPIDTIICNPPFHSGNRISTAAAERMFKQTANIISKQGQLLVVANRHLGYIASLKKSFEHVQLLASDAKFVIYQCSTPKQGSTPRPKSAHTNKPTGKSTGKPVGKPFAKSSTKQKNAAKIKAKKYV